MGTDFEKRLEEVNDAILRALEEEPHATVTMVRAGDTLDVDVQAWKSPHRTTLLVTGDGITVRDDFGPFHWTRHVPRQSIEQVAGAVFTFADWDAHLAIHTKHKTLRVAWGMEEKTAHDVAAAIREVLQLS